MVLIMLSLSSAAGHCLKPVEKSKSFHDSPVGVGCTVASWAISRCS